MGLLESQVQRRKWGLPAPTRRTAILSLVAVFLFLIIFQTLPPYSVNTQYNELPGEYTRTKPPPSPFHSPDSIVGSAQPPYRPKAHDGPIAPNDPLCDGFPNVGSLAIILKTGASESFSKIPTQLLTNMRCISGGDFVIFSDKEEVIGGVQVYDSLDNVLPSVMADNFEFDIYRAQKACIVDREHCKIPMFNGYDDRPAGWRLDKYKNIHMADKVWKSMPGRDWYFFIDADTYVFWDTLVQWLRQMDPKKKHFMGNIHDHGTGPFAHGGSGYLLSRPAMADLLDRNPGVAHVYDVRVLDECCGDLMFSWAMKEKADIEVSGVWPTLSEESFWNTPYGHWTWCQPVASMHHMSAEETSLLWEFERKRYATTVPSKRTRPIVFRDVFLALVADRIRVSGPQRSDWDNWSDGWIVHGNHPVAKDWTAAQRAATKSAEHCRQACEAEEICFQWNWSGENGGTCAISWSFRLGVPEREGSGKVSGWMMDRIETFIESHQCEGLVEWTLSRGLPASS